MMYSKPRSDAAVRDAMKMELIREFPGCAHHFMSNELCDAAEKRRASFWKLHRQECLVEFKHRNNGRSPAWLDAIL